MVEQIVRGGERSQTYIPSVHHQSSFNGLARVLVAAAVVVVVVVVVIVVVAVEVAFNIFFLAMASITMMMLIGVNDDDVMKCFCCRYPKLNSHVNDDWTEYTMKGAHNIGV